MEELSSELGEGCIVFVFLVRCASENLDGLAVSQEVATYFSEAREML